MYLNVLARIFESLKKGNKTSNKIEPTIAITPPSLFGIDRKIA
jgi:hypothetical protein